MTDRELLELAAKAAGMSDAASHPDLWNPLTDDGDALRLAVKLDLNVDCESRVSTPHTKVFRGGLQQYYAHEVHGSDPCAATRRAIVRAAAEIGRALP